MLDNFNNMSPAAAENSCRFTALMESGGVSEVDLNGNQKNLDRRKRLNLRRLKKLSENFDVIATDYRCYKKYKTENGENGVVVLSASPKVPLDVLTESERVVPGSSSNVDDVNKVSDSLQSFTCRSYGSISLIGRRREMEDAVAVKLGLLSKGGKKYDFFGVYDGHGGSPVAHACRESLHRIMVQEVMKENDECVVINWEKVMKESFCKMDEEVNMKGAAEMATMGSTAVVAVVGKEEVVVANCGDSRAVISRGGVAVPMSNDHKPDRADELDRIESLGGKVINWNGHRVLGVLATSRSIGDNYLKPYVIPDPEVIVSKRGNADEFLILASDGLWDVIPNDVACEITRRCLNGQMTRRCSQQQQGESVAAQAASFLAELAIGRGSKDNISVIVVELNRSSVSPTND